MSAPPAQGQERRGFTMLLSLGYGWQSTPDLEITNYAFSQNFAAGTTSGLAGLNLGMGGFVSDEVALMFRISGTTASRDFVDQDQVTRSDDVICGVGVLDMQWWVTKRLNLEIGGGYGIFATDLETERGVGLLAGVGYSILSRKKHSLQIGLENAVFIKNEIVVNNLGVCMGFQFL